MLRKAIKLTPRGDLKSSCSDKFQKIYWKTPLTEPFFSKAVSCKKCIITKTYIILSALLVNFGKLSEQLLCGTPAISRSEKFGTIPCLNPFYGKVASCIPANLPEKRLCWDVILALGKLQDYMQQLYKRCLCLAVFVVIIFCRFLCMSY